MGNVSFAFISVIGCYTICSGKSFRRSLMMVSLRLQNGIYYFVCKQLSRWYFINYKADKKQRN